MKEVIDFSNEADKRKLFEIIKTRKPLKYIVEFKIAREKRSNLQNNYYHVCKAIIADHCGYDVRNKADMDEFHLILKLKFWGYKEKEINGTIYQIPISTTSSDTADFSIKIEQIRLWALQEFECYCPTPEEFKIHQIELCVKYLNGNN